MSEEKLDQWIFKLVLLGDHAVGKTSLINQYMDKMFEEDYKPTIGVNIIQKTIELKQIKSNVRLILWDIAWQEKYQKFRQYYFEGCVGALLVYDITRETTFENIKSKWYKDFKQYVETKNHTYVLIGNKNDLENERCVANNDGKNLADAIGATDFIETSAKQGKNVEKAFLRLVQKVLSNQGVNFDID